jgi:tetratricopeptide (TPR) repeat protein
MNDSNKKIAIFAFIFILSAVILLFAMPRQQLPPGHDQNANIAAVDSLNNMLNARLGELLQLHGKYPDSTAIMVQLGNVYYDLDNPENAIVFYDMSLKKNPQDASVLADCAVMYFKTGDSDKALQYLDKAIELQPDLAQAWFNKGLILMTAKDRHQEGLEVWRHFIKLAPESQEAKLIKSQIDAIEAGQG